MKFEILWEDMAPRDVSPPRACDLWYQCLDCGESIPSQPADSTQCRCGNVHIDVGYIRLGVDRPARARVIRLLPESAEEIEAQRLLREALSGVEAALATARRGGPAPAVPRRLERIARGLQKMIDATPAPSSERIPAPGLTRLIEGVWEPGDPLGHEIVAAERAYRKLPRRAARSRRSH